MVSTNLNSKSNKIEWFANKKSIKLDILPGVMDLVETGNSMKTIRGIPLRKQSCRFLLRGLRLQACLPRHLPDGCTP